MRLALTTAFFAAASADPLLAERAELAASLPTVPLSESVMEKRAAAAAPAGFKPLHPDNANATATGTRILIMGDSWGTLSPATEYFEKELKEHNCPLGGFTNIAVGGSTAREWAEDAKLKEAAEQAPKHDHVWITLMGNDARAEMPACAAKGKTAEQCGDELMVSALARMGKIVDNIHTANPAAKIVGFGYDIMFGGLGCEVVQRELFPQCWSNSTTHKEPIKCFNTELVRLQEAWETLASTRPFITPINILGVTQAAHGDKGVTVGHPDLAINGPAKYWPITLICIHPSKGVGDGSGAMVIMKEFYKQYWSAALGC